VPCTTLNINVGFPDSKSKQILLGRGGSYVKMNVSKRDLSTKYGVTSGITASIHEPQKVNLYLLRSTNSVPDLTVFS